MRRQDHLFFGDAFHGLIHGASRLDTAAIVAEGISACLLEAMKVNQFLTGPSMRDCTILKNMDDPFFLIQRSLCLHACWRVRYRINVWHGANRGKTTMSSCLAAGFDRFLIGLARFSEMHVNVNQSWCY